MNPYGVQWDPAAIRQLAAAWMQAADRRAVTAAQHQIDRLLAPDPTGVGQHLHEGLYQLRVPPLIAFYSVDEVQRRVEVSEIRYLH